MTKHHVIDRNRSLRDQDPTSAFTGKHQGIDWGSLDNLDETEHKERQGLLKKYAVQRQLVIQGSWLLQSMLGDGRRKFSEEQEKEIANTFEDIAKTIKSGSSSSTQFE